MMQSLLLETVLQQQQKIALVWIDNTLIGMNFSPDDMSRKL